MRWRRAIVTGASGFIGSELTRRLLADGFAVVAVGRDAARLPRGAERVEVESFTFEALKAALAKQECDVVFHLAAYGVAPHERDLETMLAVNVSGTAAIVQVAAGLGARAIVYGGSCSEYAAAEPGTLIDEQHPISTTNLYGSTKAAGGLCGRATAARNGLIFQWLRIFGVFGPGEAPHRLMPAIATQLAQDIPVKLSPGEQVRDVLYIDEVVGALMQCADAAFDGEAGPLNVCSGRPVSVRAMATMLADAMGKSRELLQFGALPYRPDDNPWLVGSAARIEQSTGFRSTLPLEDAVAKFLSEFSVSRRTTAA